MKKLNFEHFIFRPNFLKKKDESRVNLIMLKNIQKIVTVLSHRQGQ